MKTSQKIMMAASLAAGIAAFVFARRKASRPSEKEEYKFFKKSRHLTPAFAKHNKYS